MYIKIKIIMISFYHLWNLLHMPCLNTTTTCVFILPVDLKLINQMLLHLTFKMVRLCQYLSAWDSSKHLSMLFSESYTIPEIYIDSWLPRLLKMVITLDLKLG